MANLITLFRFFLTFPTFYAVLGGYERLSSILILLGALSDLLDGNLARRSREKNRWGALLDPMVDKVFFLSVLSAFLYVQKVHPLSFILLLIRELFLSFLRSVSVEKGYIMQASYLGKTKAFFEFLSLFLLSLESSAGNLALWTAVIFAYISMWDYVLKYITFEKS
jgi:CDP-diacylglycerol--glycerol-3-phosphate 3-phosphatidyltransferase